jgi:exosortase A-associated hydrolase 2
MISGHFIPSSAGKVLLTLTGTLPARQAVLCLPPLFEEMNLARAVMAKQAQYFAAQGLPVCLLDYSGTGDSEGEIDQVSADTWLQDVLVAGQWLLSQGVERISLWGVRFGGLMQLHFQQQLHQALPVQSQLLWKPVTAGKLMTSQLLRLKQANSMMQGDAEKVNWRQRIKEGETVEVAGYPLNEMLLASIEKLKAEAGLIPQSPVTWLELGTEKLTPIIERLTADWPEPDLQLQTIACPAFWQIPETFDVPALYPIGLKGVQG